MQAKCIHGVRDAGINTGLPAAEFRCYACVTKLPTLKQQKKRHFVIYEFNYSQQEKCYWLHFCKHPFKSTFVLLKRVLQMDMVVYSK